MQQEDAYASKLFHSSTEYWLGPSQFFIGLLQSCTERCPRLAELTQVHVDLKTSNKTSLYIYIKQLDLERKKLHPSNTELCTDDFPHFNIQLSPYMSAVNQRKPEDKSYAVFFRGTTGRHLALAMSLPYSQWVQG